MAADKGLRQRPGDQPIPRPDNTAEPSVQEELIRLVGERRELGSQRYGTDLRTFNGRDVVRDAIEEALDLASYLTQLKMEQERLSASGGTAALVEILDRAGVDTSRDNIIRVSQIVERLQGWAHAQIATRTNWLSRKLADESDAKRDLERQALDLAEQLSRVTDERGRRQLAAQDRYEMLLVAWEPCTPAWCADRDDNACALTARAWVPGSSSSHYHPRGVGLPRQNAIERKVHHSGRIEQEDQEWQES